MVEVFNCTVINELPETSKLVDEYVAANYSVKISTDDGEQLSPVQAIESIADVCKFNNLPESSRISYEVRDYVLTLEHVIEKLCADLRGMREQINTQRGNKHG